MSADVGDRQAIRPQSFDDYHGQRQVVEGVRRGVEAARRGGWRLDHQLFSGPPGTGKTSIAELIAYELGQRLERTCAPSLSHRGELASLLVSLRDGDVLFIDEVHRLPVVLQEMLYTAMEDFRVALPRGIGGQRAITVPLPQFTLLAATTHPSRLAAPMRDRFGAHWQFSYYDEQSIATIVERTASLLGLEIDREACIEISRRSRMTPRIANHLVRRVRDFACVAPNRPRKGPLHVDRSTVVDALTELAIDHRGLEAIDRAYLRALAMRPRGMGAGAIAATLQSSRNHLEEVVEPFLLRLGMISRTESGRLLTEIGREHLGESAPISVTTSVGGGHESAEMERQIA